MWPILLSVLLLSLMYYSLRFIPIRGADHLSPSSLAALETEKNKPIIIDVREFHDARRNPVQHSVNIPLPYLKRHYPREQNSPVHIVGKDRVEINLSARFLKKKGFAVSGYTQMITCRSIREQAEPNNQAVCNDAP